jgi:hypothetical protein
MVVPIGSACDNQVVLIMQFILSRFAALEKLDVDEDVNRAWGNIKENIKTSAKEGLGLHELK